MRPRSAFDWAAPALTLALVGGLAFAQAPVAPEKPKAKAEETTPSLDAVAIDKKAIEEVKANSKLMKNLEHLCDVIGPRITGSPNLEKANNWAAEKMKEYGLTNVVLEPWEIPLGWERGTATR